MNYFVMKPDDRVKNAFKINAESIAFDTTEPFAAFCDFSPSTDFVDFFTLRKQFNHLFCASDPLKEMIDIYADDFSAMPFFVIDKHQKGQMVYWILNLESIDCLEEKPFMRYDNLTLHSDQIKNKYIFRINYEKQEYVIVSLVLAENILRKIPSGIRFYPVNVT